MDKRILGKTGLAVTIVGYGAIKLPNITQAEADECLNLALDLGINYVDTARSYRDSEEKIGKAISHRRDDFYIATKTGARDAKGVEEHLAISLGNLRTDYIDLYQLHTVSDRERWEAVRAPGGAYEAALQAREAGKVGHIGITIHRDLQVMREAIASGLFETIMVCYNPLDSENVEAEILPAAEAADMGVIVMKALSGGQLCQPLQQREAGLGGPDAIVAGSLRYVLGNPNVSLVIPGMQAVHEVRENVTVGDEYTPLSADEQQQLMRLIARMKGDYRYDQVCLRCGYCRPCTVGIDIPAVFKAGDMLAAYSENLHHVALEVWESLEVSPDECIECEKCLEKCPAGINIPEQLKRVTAAFAEYQQGQD